MPTIASLAGPDGHAVTVVLDDAIQPWPADMPSDYEAVTDEQRAFARGLALADLVEDLEQAARDDADGWSPTVSWDVEPVSADELVVSLSGPAHELDLALLASVDPAELETNAARVAYLRGVERLAGKVAALRAAVLVAMAGAEASGDHLLETSLEHEVAVALRASRSAAGKWIETARALASTFPGFAAALTAGEVSEGHCRLLVDKTRAVVDTGVLAAIEKRVLPKAKRLPVGRFGKEVAAAVVDLDADAVTRHRRACDQRGVYSRQLDDGLGFLGVVDEWGVISALQATIDADAHVLRQARGGAAAVNDGDDEARTGACRADALAARVLGQVDEDGTVTWDPRDSVAVTLDLVMDLGTLRGEAERMALLADQPVPAQIAREHADAVRTWRRVVTDPVDGHLLDYGTRQYLPDPLRRFVLARDGGCVAPDCTTRSPRRMQMDHVVPFPAGPSSAANCDTKCVTTHQLKTADHIHVSDSSADGSRTWTTGWGQQVRIPPRPFLHDPRDPQDRADSSEPSGPPPEDPPRGPRTTRPQPPGPPPDLDTPPF